MQEHTKRPHTDTVELCFVGPAAEREKAVKALSDLGYVETSDSIPWREAFSEHEDRPAYSVALKAFREMRGLTQTSLAEATGIPQGHISAMERGKMTIGKERARRLAEALDAGYRIFL
jgi:DNA-binding XRE family transcriptional regulator